MEEYLLLKDALRRLEESPFEAAWTAAEDDPIVGRSVEETYHLAQTFIGPEGILTLFRDGTPPEWFEELVAADATDALELDWLLRGDLASILKVMPWVGRSFPRLDAGGAPPTATRCLLVPANTHSGLEVAAGGDIGGRIVSQHEDNIRRTVEARDAPHLIEETRRTRQFLHSLAPLASPVSMPCVGVWRLYTSAKRRLRPWETYLRSEWGVDVFQAPAMQPSRPIRDELHNSLLVVALGTLSRMLAVVRAVEEAFRDRQIDDPCTSAYNAAIRASLNSWVDDAALMKSAPRKAQQETAGVSLAAHVLARISLGHSRGTTKARGRPGKRLDDALHQTWHDDPSIPCSVAHDAALIHQALSHVWTAPGVLELNSSARLASPGDDAQLRKAVNSVTNAIARQATARRVRRNARGETYSAQRELGLRGDRKDDAPDPLEEFLATEEAVSTSALVEEYLELIPLLPPAQRQIAEMKLVRGLSYRQIASCRVKSVGGSKANWSKAKKNLRRLHVERFGHDGIA